MKNKKVLIATLVSSLAIVVICLVLVLSKNFINKEGSANGVEIIAKSKVGNITTGDVNNYISTLEKTFGQKIDTSNLKDEEMELIINEIVNNKIILNKAKKSGIQNTKEYKERIKQIEDNLLKELFLQDLINKNITEETIKARYDEVNEVLKDKKEFKVKHIVVKTEEEIKKVIRELKRNTFEEVAEKYSIDSSKSTGGDLGYVIEGQTVKEFDEVLQKQPLNELSEPFKTQFGWHVLIKEDERKATIADYEQTKNTVRDALVRDFMRNYGLENIKDVNITILNKVNK